MSSTSKRTWHSTAFPSQRQLGGTTERGRRSGWIPSKEQIRDMMHESTEGGRAICYFCHTGFTMKYMKLARVAGFRTEFVCKDCLCEHNLTAIK